MTQEKVAAANVLFCCDDVVCRSRGATGNRSRWLVVIDHVARGPPSDESTMNDYNDAYTVCLRNARSAALIGQLDDQSSVANYIALFADQCRSIGFLQKTRHWISYVAFTVFLPRDALMQANHLHVCLSLSSCALRAPNASSCVWLETTLDLRCTNPISRSFTSFSQTASTDLCMDSFFWATRFMALFFRLFSFLGRVLD